MLLTDVQGCQYCLFDPEIASAQVYSDNQDEIMFGVGNPSLQVIKNFGLSHKCNTFCIAVGLDPFNKEEFEHITVDYPIDG